MKVRELIEKLSALPQDANVGIIYDGANRIDLEIVWLSHKGDVVVSARDTFVYYEEDQPVSIEKQKDWYAGDFKG